MEIEGENVKGKGVEKWKKDNAIYEGGRGRPHAYRQEREPGKKIITTYVMNTRIICRFINICLLASYIVEVTSYTGNPEGSGGTAQAGDQSEETQKGSTEPISRPTGGNGIISQNFTVISSSDAKQEKITESCSQDSRNPEDESKIPEESRDFQILTVKDGKQYTIATADASRYDLVTLKYGFKYLFKEGVLCTQVKHKHVTVWNHDLDVHGKTYPKKVYYNTVFRLLIILFNNKWYYGFEYVNGHWKYNHSKSRLRGSKFFIEDLDPMDGSEYEDSLKYTEQLDLEFETQSMCSDQGSLASDLLTELEEEKIDKDQFTICTVDDVDSVNVKINESSKYTFNELKYGFNYVFNEGVKCVEVKHKDMTVWKHSKETHEEKYPQKLYYNNVLKSLSVVLANNWFYSYEYVDGRWRFNYEKSEGRACEFCLEIPKEENDIELFDRSTRYYVTKNGHKYSFCFRDQTDCVKVKVGDDVAWKHDPVKHPDEYPISVLYNVTTGTITVSYYRDDAAFEDHRYLNEQGKWQPYSPLTYISSVYHH
ncbi:hypothetical protein MACJ_001242 [Theileria orientalis]|uniref:Uncharacterized protein n=1 Tax=Theileria orientalis TaxID=68886 RepID=A0A976QT95_THEOR|nr:hypothetical protein MACJ_001242 [Theileria orientalis]